MSRVTAAAVRITFVHAVAEAKVSSASSSFVLSARHTLCVGVGCGSTRVQPEGVCSGTVVPPKGAVGRFAASRKM